MKWVAIVAIVGVGLYLYATRAIDASIAGVTSLIPSVDLSQHSSGDDDESTVDALGWLGEQL